jgi:hypothetical protein
MGKQNLKFTRPPSIRIKKEVVFAPPHGKGILSGSLKGVIRNLESAAVPAQNHVGRPLDPGMDMGYEKFGRMKFPAVESRLGLFPHELGPLLLRLRS